MMKIINIILGRLGICKHICRLTYLNLHINEYSEYTVHRCIKCGKYIKNPYKNI